jgi:ribosomal protein S15P/S13E
VASKTIKLPRFGDLLHQLEMLLEEATAVREHLAATRRDSRALSFWAERRRMLHVRRNQEREREQSIEMGRMSETWLASLRDFPSDEP